MGRPKGSKNKKSSIVYPRKCANCDYEANNPAMYFYHTQTHDSIPVGTKCHLGCGDDAKFKNTNGKYTCNKNFSDCLSYRNNLAEITKQGWIDADSRKEKTKKIFETMVVYNDEMRAKSIAAIKEKAIILPSDAKNYRSYARKCRKIAQDWAKENGHILGVTGNHVDHKLSVSTCYNLGISIDVANHPANLRVVDYKVNTAKGCNDSITYDELLEHIKNYNDS